MAEVVEGMGIPGYHARPFLEGRTVAELTGIASNLGLAWKKTPRKAVVIDGLVAALSDARVVHAAQSELPAYVTDLFHALREDGGYAPWDVLIETGIADYSDQLGGYEPEPSALRLLEQRGLVLSSRYGQEAGVYGAVVPGEVEVALSGGRVVPRSRPQPPDPREVVDVPGPERDPEQLVMEAGLLLEWWGAHPATRLKGGGLGTRELRKAAQQTGIDERVVRFIYALLAEGGLLHQDAEVVTPTSQTEMWAERTPAERWDLLFRVWRESLLWSESKEGLIALGKDDLIDHSEIRRAALAALQRRRRSIAGLAAAAAVALLAAVLVLPASLGGRDQTGPAAGDRTFIEIPTGAPSHITASGDNVWLVSPTELRRIDAATNRLTTLVQGLTPDNVVDMVADEDVVWVVGRGNRFGFVSSVDASGRGLQEIGRFNTELHAVDVDRGHVWGADRVNSAVWRIDPRTGSYERSYRTGLESPLRGPVDLAAGHGYLWLLAGESLVRIDPSAPEKMRSLPLNECPDLAVDESAVWLLDSCQDVVLRLDPETLRSVGAVESDGRDFGDRIVAGLGSLWITGESVTRVDPGTNRIDGPPIEVDGGASEIAVGDDSLWMATPRGVLRYTPEDVAPAPGGDAARRRREP